LKDRVAWRILEPGMAYDDLSGSVLGSYRITGQLNRGGMGAVFRAQHELLGKPAAIKVLRPELCANSEIIDRFFKEAFAASAIRHPGIVEVFDFGYHADGRAYLVMELLEGETLSARLARTGLDEIRAAVIARGIASALGAAHAKGFIHRDLKPDNVFLVPDPDMPSGERPKVLDFGIAKLSEEDQRRVSKTRTGALLGTPSYMAPEQARAAGEIDSRADLYSLGCMLYEMLTGAPPFVAEGAGEVIALHLFAEPELPSAKRPGVSEEMDRITMRLLAKEPEGRYANAFEVVEALSAAIPTLSGRMAAVAPGTVRRQALVVPTLSGAMPASASPRTAHGSPAALTPLPLHPVPAPASRARAMRPAILAGVMTLGIAAAIVVFLVLRPPKKRAAPPPTAPAPTKVTTIAPAPAPVAPAEVSYHLAITPPDVAASATVTVDGEAAALTSKGFFSRPARPDRRLVVVRAPGFRDETFTVAGDTDDSREISLVRIGGQVSRPPTSSSTGTKRPPRDVQSSDPGAGSAAAKDGAKDGTKDGTVTSGSGSRFYNTLDDDDDDEKK
jgi:serine/threonine protein kinase